MMFSKSKIRISKSETNEENSKWVNTIFVFPVSKFGFVSNFEFRISNFGWLFLISLAVLSPALVLAQNQTEISAPANVTVEPAKASLADAEGYYLDGKQAFSAGNWAQAIVQFKKAEAILDSGELPAVVPAETVLVPPKPAAPARPAKKAADKLKHKQEQKDKLRDDIQELRRRLKKEPRNADLCYNLGVLYLQNEDYQEAARTFKRVTILKPRDYEAYFNLGVVYDKYIFNNDLAEKYYKKYLRFAPPSENTEDVKIWLENLVLQGKPEA